MKLKLASGRLSSRRTSHLLKFYSHLQAPAKALLEIAQALDPERVEPKKSVPRKPRKQTPRGKSVSKGSHVPSPAASLASFLPQSCHNTSFQRPNSESSATTARRSNAKSAGERLTRVGRYCYEPH